MLIEVGVYHVQYDEATNEFMVTDQLGQRGQQRVAQLHEVISFIEADLQEMEVAINDTEI